LARQLSWYELQAVGHQPLAGGPDDSASLSSLLGKVSRQR